jgi:hypothetical protein
VWYATYRDKEKNKRGEKEKRISPEREGERERE